MRLHKAILTKEQFNLLPLIEQFNKEFVLVGGTAIALQIGHRRSIDFDLFSYKDFDNKKIKRKILRYIKIDKIHTDESGQYTMTIKGVRITFFNYLYKIKSPVRFDDIIKMPNLLTLAAMKAFTLSFRPKWKDYVDLYFLLRDYYSIDEISRQAAKIFGGEFNERIFREALVYFDDINYSEPVEFLPGFEVDDKIIKKKLVAFSLE